MTLTRSRLAVPAALLMLGACAAAMASEGAQTPPKFQTCLWPNPCGAKGSAPIRPPSEEPAPAPRPEKPDEAKERPAAPSDPLEARILEGRLRGEEGVVSALRIRENGVERIVYNGAALGCTAALASGGRSVALPESALGASGTRFEICRWPKKCGAREAGAKGKVDSDKPTAGQLNGMPEKPADKMWEATAKR